VSTPTQERVMVGLPSDLTAALRERLRQMDGPEIADAPLGFLLRYLAAKFVGIPHDQALRYARAMPRGRTYDHDYPNVAELTRQ
jgi:predicted alpha/beta hydrolase